MLRKCICGAKHFSIHLRLCVHRADQALTTLAMRKFCEDKVSTSLQPSQNRSDTHMYLLPFHKRLFFFFIKHPSSPPSLISSSRLPQVHLLLWWSVVSDHQNEQQSSVPTPDPCSITTELSGRRRSVKHIYTYIFKHSTQKKSPKLTLYLQTASASAGFYPFLKIYQSLQLVYTSGI